MRGLPQRAVEPGPDVPLGRCDLRRVPDAAGRRGQDGVRFQPFSRELGRRRGIDADHADDGQGLGREPHAIRQQAIDGAAQILSGDIAKFGSVPLALAAYNAGAGAVEQYGGIPPYAETQDYVNTIMGLVGGTT